MVGEWNSGRATVGQIRAIAPTDFKKILFYLSFEKKYNKTKFALVISVPISKRFWKTQDNEGYLDNKEMQLIEVAPRNWPTIIF